MEKTLKTLKQDPAESMKYVKREIDINFERMGYILPIRLSDDTFNGIMNFIKATTKDDISTDQLQKALVSKVHSSDFFSISKLIFIFNDFVGIFVR